MNETPDDMVPVVQRRRRWWWIAAGLVLAILLILWLVRTPIADKFIRQQLDQRGVPASYSIERIGFRTQRLTNIVVGDPAQPDLTARAVEVNLGYGFSGPYVTSISADGVRLYGRISDGRLSLGALDKFRDPTSTDPFALPDMTVMLSDARARVSTPWGNVGAALNGRGNLRKSFSGTLAILAPTIAAGNCTARDLSFYGKVMVRDVRPQLVGPLRGATLSCPQMNIAAASPQLALDVALSEDLANWEGRVDGRVATLAAGALQAKRLELAVKFGGNADRTLLDSDGKISQLRTDDIRAESVTVDVNTEIGKAPAKLTGTIGFARASVSNSLRQSIRQSASSLSASPVGPLADKVTAALAQVLADVSGSAGIALAGEGRTARLEIRAPQLTSASGARFTGAANSQIAYLLASPDPAFLVAGSWSFGGGDLPSGSLTLDRQANGGLSGEARISPYRAGTAQMALSPVRFNGDGSGLLRFATMATLSGPLGDGRIDQLLVPINGVLSPTGALALNGGCSRVSIAGAATSGFRFGRNALDLCSRPGQTLLALGPGGARGNIMVPRVAIRGTSGGSALAIDASRAQFDLATMRWVIALANVRLGTGDAATHFTAKSISGRTTSSGQVGELAGAAGKIGAVPLNMSAIAGTWSWSKQTLGLDGSLTLSDAEVDARFAPLLSTDARLRFAKGVIDATASFSERETGTPVVSTVIRHELAGGTGFADLRVRELRFDDGFQPDQLTRLALGVVANVQGNVVGDGRIDWSPAGVTSRGTFATANTELAAAFGSVSGATTTLTFDDLIGLRSAPAQTIRLGEINPGIQLFDGEIEYQLLGDNRIRIEGGSWPFSGGELQLHPTTLDFGTDTPRRLTFDLVGVDAAVFMRNSGFDNIAATGTFDGTVPVVFDGLGGSIVDGRIDARGGGGTLAYIGELSNHDLGTMANFAFGALRSLKYSDLTIVLNGDLDGEMVTDIRFGGIGQGAGAAQNFITRQVAKLPFVFNIKINGPFRQLISSAKGLYDPTLYIEQNLPALMQAQEDATAAANPPTVQPPASESVQ